MPTLAHLQSAKFPKVVHSDRVDISGGTMFKVLFNELLRCLGLRLLQWTNLEAHYQVYFFPKNSDHCYFYQDGSGWKIIDRRYIKIDVKQEPWKRKGRV
jgi:hypothetical protein